MTAVAVADVTMSAGEARTLTDQIKVGVETVWQLVIRAYHDGAWSALGYKSWDDYCTREFGSARIRLPREKRAETIGSLYDAGLSTRAIAAVTGESVGTVHSTGESLGVQNRTPSTKSTKGIDGKSYPDSVTVEKRRKKVAELLGQGRKPADIAAALDVPVKTVLNDKLIIARDAEPEPTFRSSKAAASRLDRIRELAEQGHSASFIATEVGVTEERVRENARRHGVDIVADKVLRSSRRIDGDRVVEAIVTRVEFDYFNDSVFATVDLSKLDKGRIGEWVNSLEASIKSLRKLKSELSRELTRE